MAIKAVVFDFGGVLIDWSPDTTLERGLKAMFDSYPESRRD